MTVITDEQRTAPPDNISAADEPPEATEDDAPYGWMRDPGTGELRAKKKPGKQPRPHAPPDPQTMPDLDQGEDEPPPPRPRGRTRPARSQPVEVADGPPMPRGGIIAAGVNKLYRRAGKVIRGMDPDIGQAVIECTRKDDPDDITVGEAWEAVCKVNPRIRAFVLRAVAGGVWTDLVMAHAPIGMAILMKPWIAGRLMTGEGMIARLASSFLEPDEDTKDGDLTPEDGEQIADVVQQTGAMIAERVITPKHDGSTPYAQLQRLAQRIAQGDKIEKLREQFDLTDQQFKQAQDMAHEIRKRLMRQHTRASRRRH